MVELVVTNSARQTGDAAVVKRSGNPANISLDVLSHLDTLASSRILGRVTASTGEVEDLTAAQVRTLLNVADGATANAGALADLDTVDTAQIDDDAVTLAKIATGTADRLIGTDGSGNPTEVTIGTGLDLTAGELTNTGSGSGDVSGPASSTSGNVATFDGTTGKTIQDGGKALPTGSVVGTTDTQTLTGKTIDADNNTISNIALGAEATGAISDLSDVDTTGVQDGDFLAWNNSESEWQAQATNDVSLSANQYPARDSGDTAMEARADKRALTGSVVTDTNGTYSLGFLPFAGVATNVRLKTVGGTCDVVVSKNGTAINGFGTAVSITSTAGDTASTETFAADDLITLTTSNASTLTGVVFSLEFTRTAN